MWKWQCSRVYHLDLEIITGPSLSWASINSLLKGIKGVTATGQMCNTSTQGMLNKCWPCRWCANLKQKYKKIWKYESKTMLCLLWLHQSISLEDLFNLILGMKPINLRLTNKSVTTKLGMTRWPAACLRMELEVWALDMKRKGIRTWEYNF